MSYQLRHLQQTVDYIINQLRYNDPKLKTLTASDKKWLRQELLFAIDPLQRRNPKNIAINISNQYLESFCEQLHERNILFPEHTTYLLKREGRSFECRAGVDKKLIYDCKPIKPKVAARRISELEEVLHELTFDSASNDNNTAYTPGFSSSTSSITTGEQIAALRHCAVQRIVNTP